MIGLIAIYTALCIGWLIGWFSCAVITRRTKA